MGQSLNRQSRRETDRRGSLLTGMCTGPGAVPCNSHTAPSSACARERQGTRPFMTFPLDLAFAAPPREATEEETGAFRDEVCCHIAGEWQSWDSESNSRALTAAHSGLLSFLTGK